MEIDPLTAVEAALDDLPDFNTIARDILEQHPVLTPELLAHELAHAYEAGVECGVAHGQSENKTPPPTQEER